jgi:hypothetical protein
LGWNSANRPVLTRLVVAVSSVNGLAGQVSMLRVQGIRQPAVVRVQDRQLGKRRLRSDRELQRSAAAVNAAKPLTVTTPLRLWRGFSGYV